MKTQLRKAGANWVDGDRFFDREAEIEALTERVHDGAHTLLTAQRRMGKTSLVRELLRRLDAEGDYETLFVDLEAANDAADAVAEIAVQARPIRSAWARISSNFANRMRDIRHHVDELALSELTVKLRAGMDAGNWQHSGDQVFEALARNDRPVVLAIDELPILVNRMVKGHDYQITPERRQVADAFLSWLRRNGQEHRRRVCIIVSGSIGLEPILKQAGLSAQANILSPFELHPWSHEVSVSCLGALATTYGLDLSESVRHEMCRRLRCCVPHHVQQFFDSLHEHLRRAGRISATMDDVAAVYERDLLSVRGRSTWSTTRCDSGWPSGLRAIGPLLIFSQRRRSTTACSHMKQFGSTSQRRWPHSPKRRSRLTTYSTRCNTTATWNAVTKAIASSPAYSRTGGSHATDNTSLQLPRDSSRG